MNKIIITEQPLSVVITDNANTTVVESTNVASVATITQGPQGPQGVAGPVGTTYLHTQATSSSTWTINHNLGHVPIVEVFDAGSQQIDTEITNPSLNTTVILFTVPTAGFARLI